MSNSPRIRSHATSRAWLSQLGTHLMDYVLWFNNRSKVRWVIGHAQDTQMLDDTHPSADFVVGTLEFENGVRGIIECGAHAPHFIPGDSALRTLPFWTDRSVTVHGTHGDAQVVTGAGWRAMTKTSGGQVLGGTGTFDPSYEQPRYLHELADWLDGTIPTHACNGDMSYHGFEAIMTLYISSLETRRVDLPLGTLPQGSLITRLRAALPPQSGVCWTMIRLGGYGVPTTSEDPAEIARAHRAFGYRAAYCPAVSLTDAARIAAITRAFAQEDVEIAEVAAWTSVVQPDPGERRAARAYVSERLALADEVGARCCITYVGTLGSGPSYGPHPDNLTQTGFDSFVEAAREIIDAVKPKRAKFTFEMMQWLLPDSADVYLALIKAIDRPAFAAHMDPVNLIVSPRQFYDTAALIRHCFAVLGPWIVSAHAKDITLRGQLALHLDEVIPGRGGLDYAAYLSALEHNGRGVPLMLEHLKDEDYPEARDFLKGVGARLGIAI